MRRVLTFGLFLLLALAAWPHVARAGGRMALVVGVARYDRVPELKNSANDARDMAQALRAIGFDVTEVVDPDQRGLQDAISRFLNRVSDADLALFYYSGHGIQLGERNFLIPRDAVLESTVDVPLRAVDLGVILDGLETRAKVRVVLLDACRDNPFAAIFRNRSIGRGLGSMSAALGTLVGFATSPGAVAADGDGRNSPFARALLKHLPTPGLDITQLMRLVRADVVKATGGQQIPWDHSSLVGEIALMPAEPAPAEAEVAATPAAADTAHLAALPDPGASRSASQRMDEALSLYRSKPGPKAFARSDTGWGYSFGKKTDLAAIDGAVHQCNAGSGKPCRIIDINGRNRQEPAVREVDTEALARRKFAATTAFADETRDFGVAAAADLHTPYHEKTPLTVPGARTVTTGALVAMLVSGKPAPVLIDVRSGDDRIRTIPGSIWLKGAGTVGGTVDTLFGTLLQAIAPDMTQPIVFYCTGPDCWLSWNASRRAVRLGYTAVHWYRGGYASWSKAKLPLVPGQLVGSLDQ